jgi:hypothetical protein
VYIQNGGDVTLVKKIIAWSCCILLAVAVTYYAASNYILSKVKENVLVENDGVKILSIARIGKWGEWASEYVLEVKIDGDLYRIWTNAQGKITDQEALHNE